MPRSRSEIADGVEQGARAVFAGAAPRTSAIKQKFREMGHTLGYRVAASGCGADVGEWLYDLVWYVESDGYFVSQPLVLESERHPDPRLDGDFDKLVQARGEVRLWICKLHRRQSLEDHLTIYKQQVNCFAGTQSGDVYVFVVYDYAGLNAHVERFEVPNPLRHSS